MSPGALRMFVGPTVVDRLTESEVVAVIGERSTPPNLLPLAVGSVNLDHLHHFRQSKNRIGAAQGGVEWLLLADGAPVARYGAMLAGEPWPRVTGADLLPALLDACEVGRLRVGFFGGLPRANAQLANVLTARFPALEVAGIWSPDRAELEDQQCAVRLAREVAAAQVDVLVVGLGKPRQELWIDRYGHVTGAEVLLAFGAAADFLAGVADRAPEVVQRCGLEWAYRLLREPRRLWRRYLVQGPLALLMLRRAKLAGPSRAGASMRGYFLV
jgi:N-acetylglucosaminyldiphosphoundecaprenol N-acetyl-beta-D-mannosaminyltransferase